MHKTLLCEAWMENLFTITGRMYCEKSLGAAKINLNSTFLFYLSWSFVLTRRCALPWVLNILMRAIYCKCSRGPHLTRETQVPHP